MSYNHLKLKEYIDIGKIYWNWLSSNPNAIHLLERNLDKINWWGLSSNPNAIHLLENNFDKIENQQINKNILSLQEKESVNNSCNFENMEPNFASNQISGNNVTSIYPEHFKKLVFLKIHEDELELGGN